MNVFTKLTTLFRAGVRESAERITDANAIRIYRQEVVDAEQLLERRRLYLAGMIATRKDLEKEIAGAEQRIRTREGQIAAVDPEERSEKLLLLAARDIAATEAHLKNLRQRHEQIAGKINGEELTLRRLVSELREHRRELRILSAQIARNGSFSGHAYGDTVAGHLATLRQTRAGISGTVCSIETSEASMEEANDRVDGDPLDRELAAQGQDPASIQLADVLARLRTIGSTA